MSILSGSRRAVLGRTNISEELNHLSISGLSVYLDARDIAGADGDAIGTWTDRIQSFAFTQGTAAKKPTLQHSFPNSEPSVRFDGTDDILVYTAANPFSAHTAGTIVCVFRIPTSVPGSDSRWFASADHDTASFDMISVAEYSGTRRAVVAVRQGNVTTSHVAWVTAPVADTTYRWVVSSDGARYAHRINDVDQGGPTILTGLNTGDWWADVGLRDSFTVGSQKSSTEFAPAKIDIGLLALYDRELTTGEFARLDSVLARRYA